MPELSIPPEIAKSCQILGWKVTSARFWGGETGYLVDTGDGITEPYSHRTIVQEAVIKLHEQQAAQQKGAN